jgi:hypothetical protein
VARERLACALVAAGLAVGGCGDGNGKGNSNGNGEGGTAEVIDWDLSRTHTTRDVDWPRPDIDAVEIRPVDSVRIELPGGQAFSDDGTIVHDVSLTRDGEHVTKVQIDSLPRTTEDAYELAIRWGREWGVPTDAIERWHHERVAGRERGEENLRSTAEAIPDRGVTVGEPDGPEPTVQIRYSFDDDERPSLVSLQFYWPPRLDAR